MQSENHRLSTRSRQRVLLTRHSPVHLGAMGRRQYEILAYQTASTLVIDFVGVSLKADSRLSK